MPKNYSIRWIIDDTQARGVFRRGNSEMEALERRALKTLTAIEAAHATAGKVGATATQAAQVAMTQAAIRGTAARKKVATDEQVHIDFGLHKLQVNGIKFQERLTSATKSESDKRKSQLDAEARYQASQALGPNGRLAQVRRKALSEEQLQIAARNRAYDAAHQQRIRQILSEQYATKSAFEDAIASSLGFSGSLSVAGIAVAGLGAAVGIVKTVAGAYGDASRAADALARKTLDTSAALRELVAIREKFAPDDADLAQYLDVRKGSGMTHQQAVGYSEELFNALGTVTKERLPEAQRSILEKEGAKTVARTARNEATARAKAGTLGLLPSFMKGPATASGVLDMNEAVDLILGRGSASAEVMASQYQQVLTSLTGEDMVGFFKDPRQSAALTSVASAFDKGAPATATIEAARELRAFTKFRKIKGLDASQAQTLEKAGIKEDDDPYQAMVKLFKFADTNMGEGEAFDTFLGRRGFRNQTGNQRLAQFYGQYKKGTLADIMGEASKPIVPGSAAVKNEAFLKSQVGRDLTSQAQADAARIEQGKVGRELLIAKQEAEAKLVSQGLEDTTVGGIRKSVAGMIGLSWVTGKPGEEILKEQQALVDANRKAGNASFGRPDWTGVGNLGLNGLFQMLQPLLQAAYGDNRESISQLKRIADLNEQQLRAMGSQPGNPGQAPRAGAPPMLPVGSPPGGPRR